MRKFYIQASNGLRYDLQDRNKCFLNSPKGLGFEKDNSYINVGNYFTVDDSKNGQKTISGSLIFKNDWYANYKEFITFIKSYSDYKLVYKYDDIDYYIDIDIVEVTKGDTEGNKYLECDIEMLSKSLWYKQTSITRTIEQSDELPQWDWRFDLMFNDETLFNITFIPDFIVQNSWGLFRNCGRFMWPVMYFIMYIAISYSENVLKKSYPYVLTFVLFIQLFEFGGYYKKRNDIIDSLAYRVCPADFLYSYDLNGINNADIQHLF